MLFSWFPFLFRHTVAYSDWLEFIGAWEKGQQNRAASPSHGDVPSVARFNRERALEQAFFAISAHCAEHGPISHVILVPFLGKGGAEKVALNYAKAVLEQKRDGSVLFVVTDRNLVDEGIQLPLGSTLLVLDQLSCGLNEESKRQLVGDLIRALRAEVVHNINSVIGWLLICSDGARLRAFTRLYANIFCFQSDEKGNRIGYAAQFLETGLPFLTCLISDNDRFIDEATREYNLGEDASTRLRAIATPSSITPRLSDAEITAVPLPAPQAASTPSGRMRVLWASRLDAQKRIDLLFEIVALCEFADFEVFGKAVTDGDNRLPELPNLSYRGPFERTEDLLAGGRCDAFVFTTREEGMPNIVLEIGALGVPIIAPDVGGIGELIDESTGYLLRAWPSASDYRDALLAIRDDPARATRKVRALQERIFEHHSWEGFVDAVRTLPGYLSLAETSNLSKLAVPGGMCAQSG